MDPASIDVHLERGVLTLSGERKSVLPSADEKATTHSSERFSGRFRRVISLPDDVDAAQCTAQYRDGILAVSIKRRQSAQPRRIEVK
jgi:HSP20 family protein